MSKYKSEKINSGPDIKNALSLLEEKRKLSEGKKSTNSLIGKIAGQTRESLGGSRKGWHSVVAGFTQGVENAAELSSIYENEELYKNHKNVIDNLTEINNANIAETEKYRRDEKGRKAIQPEFWAFESALKNGADEQSRLDMVNKMRRKYEDITGEKLSPVVSGLTNSKYDYVDEEGNISNVPALIFGDEYTNNMMSSINPEHQMEQQEKRQQYAEKQALEERKVGSLEGVNDARRRKYESEIDYMPQKQDAALLRIKESGAKRVAAAHKYYTPQIAASTEVLKASQIINNIVQETPEALQTVMSLPWQSKDTNLISSTLKSATQGMNPKIANAAQKLEKELNKLRLSVAKGISNPNQMLDAIGIGSVPNLQMSPEAFSSVMNDIEASARYNYDLNKGELDSIAQAYGSDGEPLSKNVTEQSEKYLNNGMGQQPQAQEQSNTVSIKSPMTGKIAIYSRDDPNIDMILQRGGILVQ
jgi:hypothetical protein